MATSWSKLLPKIVNRTKEFASTHRWNLLVRETHVRFVLSYQERFPYPELTLNKNDVTTGIMSEMFVRVLHPRSKAATRIMANANYIGQTTVRGFAIQALVPAFLHEGLGCGNDG